MKSLFFTCLFSISVVLTTSAQDEVVSFLASGVEDAQTFTQDYMSPSTDALINGLTSNWYNSGQVKNTLGFEISIIGNASLTTSDQKSFNLNTADYSNVSFKNGQSSQMVATVLGENDPDVTMLINGTNGNLEFDLPQGLASEGIDFVPSAFIQASVGLPLHTEVKFRFLPEVDEEDISSSLYGLGLQHEFTKWIPFLKELPLAISGFVGYTNFKGQANLTDVSPFVINYDDQLLDVEVNSWHVAAIASTKWKTFNFYSSLGFISGDATTALKGTYEFNDASQDIIDLGQFKDPFEVTSSVDSMKALIGAKLKLGFFRINAEYSFQQFNTASLAINFGIK